MSAGNTIFRIVVYRQDGLWVFDDKQYDISGQPFVFGSDLILEKMVAEINDAEVRVNVLFSSIPFPGSEYCLKFVRQETEGFVYRWEEMKLQGWLSPSLRNYFMEPPPKMYLQLLAVQ